MAERYFPFDAGAGANVLETDWARMGRRWLTSGVIQGYLNALAVFADNTGMQVKLPTGAAWIEGTYYENDAQMNLAITAADPTNPRTDRVVLRVDWTANTIAAVVKTGVAAASPVAPALTQNFGVTWELLLANIQVVAAAGSILAGNVTDARSFAGPTIPNAMITLAMMAANSVDASKIVDGSVGTAEIAAGALSADATGRAKMANGYLTNALLGAAAVSAVKAGAGLVATLPRIWAFE